MTAFPLKPRTMLLIATSLLVVSLAASWLNGTLFDAKAWVDDLEFFAARIIYGVILLVLWIIFKVRDRRTARQ